MTSRCSRAKTSEPSHDDRIVAAAITSLPGIGPQRLRLLVGGLGAQRAWRVLRGEEAAPDHVAAMLRHDGLDRVLRRATTVQLLEQTAQALHDGNIRVLLATDAEFPPSMRGDFAAPAVLFARGDVSVFGKRRVGVVGTRAASAAGRHFARRLGRDLARNDVAVVSGLARGIDAAAHRGVFDALDDSAPAVSTA
ncbi:MAG: DNA-processing protein DprA, partial [Ilumatobacteraceae bacterium]